MDAIIEYLIEHGGIWGVLLAFSIAWIIFRERTFAISSKSSNKGSDLLNKSIKKIETNQNFTHTKIEEISKAMEDFKEINVRQAKAAHALQEKLQEVNDDRVDELKEILSDYNKTMTELSMGIEKMNLILDIKLGE